jgi:hypothetical protein
MAAWERHFNRESSAIPKSEIALGLKQGSARLALTLARQQAYIFDM